MKVQDIENNWLEIGDEVYYARKRNYTANGELIKGIITNITLNEVIINKKYRSTNYKTQLLLRKKNIGTDQ